MTIADRLVALLEAYAADRVIERRLRREMRALLCEKEQAQGFRCYLYTPVDGVVCATCAKRTEAWKTFRAVRAENRLALGRIERQPTPRDPRQTKPAPPPAPPADRRFMTGRNRTLAVRSKASGKEGFAYPDDPHVWVEGPGISGWYRLETIARDFIAED